MNQNQIVAHATSWTFETDKEKLQYIHEFEFKVWKIHVSITSSLNITQWII